MRRARAARLRSAAAFFAATLAAAAAGAAVGAVGGVEERAWCVVSSRHFEIVTDLRERKAHELAASLDRFRVAASALLPGEVDARRAASPTPALRLLVFRRARDFAALFGFPRIGGFA